MIQDQKKHQGQLPKPRVPRMSLGGAATQPQNNPQTTDPMN